MNSFLLFFFEKMQEYIHFIWYKIQTTRWISFPKYNINILHLYIILLFLLIFAFAYIKLTYPFWNIQPVYHSYDFWRFFYKTPFQIQRKRHNPYTKFYQPDKIKTIKYVTATDAIKDIFIDKLQCYYLLAEEMMFIMRKPEMDVIMESHLGPAFLSLYMDKVYSKTPPQNENTSKENVPEIMSNDIPIAGMLSFPINIQYKNHIHIFHYWDYIWINRVYTNRNCQRILINTHDINVRDAHPEMQCSLFRKTNVLCDGVVPIVKYKTFLCKLFYKKYDFPKKVTFMRIYKQYNIIENILTNENMEVFFDFRAYPQLPNMFMLIKKHHLIVYCMKKEDNILSVYFFKETFSLYENENIRLLRLVGSICNTNNTYIHLVGYMYSIRDIMKNNPAKYGAISIDNLSHNDIIIQNMDAPPAIHVTSVENAYYTYNYMIPQTPMNPRKFFGIL